MSLTTYTVTHDGCDVAVIDLDPADPATMNAIREMVSFWIGHEERLEEAGGDWIVCWLKMLARFILRNNHLPEDQEGWVNLDGTYATFRVTFWEGWSFDDRLTEVKACR